MVTRNQGDPLSAEAKEQLAALRLRRDRAELAARTDAEIDFSDIPRLTERDMSEFVSGPWTPLIERVLTLQLDDEVYEWLQQAGPEQIKTINLALKREAQRSSLRQQKGTEALPRAS